jgi:response regulator RpfG family c-di-GMP phosphodiesterase
MKAAINHKKTILLIDDDDDDCLLLSHALAAISNNIVLSYTQCTDHLLETIDRNRPSLILIDYYMPKRNGSDLVKQIKDHPDYKDIPVVMWSTCSVSKNVMDKIQGLQHFFQKPSCYKSLVAELKTVLLQTGLELQ